MPTKQKQTNQLPKKSIP